jgi:hypothetical protein
MKSYIFKYFFFQFSLLAVIKEMESEHYDGAVAEGRFELRPPVKSSDLEEKVLPLHR